VNVAASQEGLRKHRSGNNELIRSHDRGVLATLPMQWKSVRRLGFASQRYVLIPVASRPPAARPRTTAWIRPAGAGVIPSCMSARPHSVDLWNPSAVETGELHGDRRRAGRDPVETL